MLAALAHDVFACRAKLVSISKLCSNLSTVSDKAPSKQAALSCIAPFCLQRAADKTRSLSDIPSAK